MPTLIHKLLNGSEKNLEFGSKPLIIGRLPESEIQVREAFISRVHAGISYANNAFVLRRARLISEGQFAKNYGFQFATEFGPVPKNSPSEYAGSATHAQS